MYREFRTIFPFKSSKRLQPFDHSSIDWGHIPACFEFVDGDSSALSLSFKSLTNFFHLLATAFFHGLNNVQGRKTNISGYAIPYFKSQKEKTK